MKFLIPTFIILILCGCSPIKRHSRLVERYPHVHQIDTVIVHDTISIVVPKVKHDTVVLFEQLRDTLVIEKERLKIRIHSVHDSIFVHGECDTIKVERIVERKIPVKYYEKSCDWVRIIKWMIAFVVILVLFWFFKKIFE